MERKSRAQTESALFIAVVTAALVLVNILGFRYFKRVDLTRRELFSLSQGTHRIVEGLHDELTITVYFTPNQPPPASDDERTLRDQLDEYHSLARNRINVRFVTPDNDARKQQAEAAGCEKQVMQAVDVQQSQATALEVYRCVTFEYLGRREKIAFLAPGVQGMEYEISSILKKLETPESATRRTIGFLTGHGELTPEEGMQYLPQVLEHERLDYATRSIDLHAGADEIPTDIKGLIIVNPSRQITDRELRRIDAYLMRGGSVAVFAGGLNFPSVEPTSAVGSPSEHHLNDLLDGYGLHVETNVVLDPRANDAMAQFGRQQARVYLVTWPLVPSLSANPTTQDLTARGGLDPAFPATFRLPGIVTAYPSSITVTEARRREVGGDTRVFALSGPQSVLRTSDFDLNLVEILQRGRQLFEGATSHGPYPLGVAISGRFKSAFAGHPATGESSVVTNVPERASADARLMLVSSGNIFALEVLQKQVSQGGLPPALKMLCNTFDYLSQDTDLLAVRAKDTSDPSLRADVSETTRKLFQWGSIALLPLSIGALGVLLVSLRRARRKSYTSKYGARAN